MSHLTHYLNFKSISLEKSYRRLIDVILTTWYYYKIAKSPKNIYGAPYIVLRNCIGYYRKGVNVHVSTFCKTIILPCLSEPGELKWASQLPFKPRCSKHEGRETIIAEFENSGSIIEKGKSSKEYAESPSRVLLARQCEGARTRDRKSIRHQRRIGAEASAPAW